jgi:chloramphenicol O-acetyltransferase type A
MSGRYLDLAGWKRRSHFDFFRQYEQPFFTVCAPLDVTPAYEATRRVSGAYFLASLYLATRTANEIEEFRLRLRGDRVLVHDVVHAGSTVLNDDQTFGFCYFEYAEGFADFEARGRKALEEYRRREETLQDSGQDDVLWYSVLPWISFTSFAHARRCPAEESVPRIVFGRHYEEHGRRLMPVSVEAHHALVDGWHVGQFYERLQRYLLEAPDILGTRA